MEHLFQQKVISANNLFDDRYIASKNLYMHLFNTLPSITLVRNVQGEKVFYAIKGQFSDWIEQVLISNTRSKAGRMHEFNRTLLIMKNRCIIELDDWYCEILHDG
ncbi:MAG: AAA family ATPase, partial [Chitinophagaceae bacterium]|nr:AAA family ATPase [Chitinophagaceae bacterium]